MASIRIEENIKVDVDNNGLITFSAKNGRLAFVCVHPLDISDLIKFLVTEGYSFRG